MDKKAYQGKDRLSDFTRDLRILKIVLLAFIIGVMGAYIAYALLWLIRVITNLAFYQHLSNVFTSPSNNHLGLWVIFIPSIGGLLIGLMAKYGSEKIRGHGIPEALEAILIGGSRMEPKVAVLKPISSAISIGTGGPFGAEGPIIMTGGAFGSLFAQLFHLSASERKTLLVAGAAAGMSALLVSCTAAYLLTVLVMRRSILTEKIARRGRHITREYSIDPLELLKVQEVMDREVQSVPSTMKVSELAEHIKQRNPAYTKHRALPIVDDQKRLVGIITRDDVFLNLREKSHLSVLEAGKKDTFVTYPDEIIRDAVNKMLHQNVGRLPVVSRQDPSHVIGYLGRPSIFLAWMRRLEEEHKRDSIWQEKI